MIPKILNDVVKYVINNGINFSSVSKDGRVNSIMDEDSVASLIEGGFNAKIGASRSWYDISVTDGDNTYYINIKCTSLLKGGSDNVSSIDGILYALTGKIPTATNSWKRRFDFLVKNIADTDKDYYFLIVGKDDISKSYVTSVKHLTYITPNGNNLPFQCKWKDNSVLSHRCFIDSKNFVMGKIKKSLELRAKAYIDYQTVFGE